MGVNKYKLAVEEPVEVLSIDNSTVIKKQVCVCVCCMCSRGGNTVSTLEGEVTETIQGERSGASEDYTERTNAVCCSWY